MKPIAVGVVPRERFSMGAETLERLFECTHASIEVIVVDAAPPRWRAELGPIIESRRNVVRIINDDLILPNTARNLVTENTKAEWICFIENDVLVSPGWLDQLITACQEEGADIAVPLIMERFGPFEKVHFDDRLHSIRECYTDGGKVLNIDPRPDSKEDDRWADGRRSIQFLETHCMLISRNALDKMGGFDGNITAQEEVDISLSAYAHGVKAIIEPRAVVTFLPPPPIHADERAYYLRKWNPETYAGDYKRITRRWRLLSPPNAMGVVQSRRSYTTALDPDKQVQDQLDYRQKIVDTASELYSVNRENKPFILVHDEQLNLHDAAPGMHVQPFLERDGKYWGAPNDDSHAIAELERARSRGVKLIVFAWTSFWWLEHYAGFAKYLHEHYSLKTSNVLVTAFDLETYKRNAASI
jgi:hypothetical protein